MPETLSASVPETLAVPARTPFSVEGAVAKFSLEFRAAAEQSAAGGVEGNPAASVAEWCRAAVLEARDAVLPATESLMAFIGSNVGDDPDASRGAAGPDVSFVGSNVGDDPDAFRAPSPDYAGPDVSFVGSNVGDDPDVSRGDAGPELAFVGSNVGDDPDAVGAPADAPAEAVAA